MFLAIDTEVTTNNKGNPYDKTNKFVLGSFCTSDSSGTFNSTEEAQRLVDSFKVIICFNLKFDIAWLKNIGVKLEKKVFWDCQIAEYVLSSQTEIMPSLEKTAIKYNLGHKLDIIKTEYWEKGIDTDKIPINILKEYAIQDAKLTFKIFQEQQKLCNEHQHTLIKLMSLDANVLEEIQRNGVLVSISKMKEEKEKYIEELNQVSKLLLSYVPKDFPNFNFNSGDHLSALLYGGVLKYVTKEPSGVYKTGTKVGQIKYTNKEVVYVFPRKIKPIPKSALKKEGFYATNEPTLRKLSGENKLVELLLKHAKLTKLLDYFKYDELMEKMGWENNLLHSNFSQVTADTGRLTSSNPNIQNIPEQASIIFVSRYD